MAPPGCSAPVVRNDRSLQRSHDRAGRGPFFPMWARPLNYSAACVWVLGFHSDGHLRGRGAGGPGAFPHPRGFVGAVLASTATRRPRPSDGPPRGLSAVSRHGAGTKLHGGAAGCGMIERQTRCRVALDEPRSARVSADRFASSPAPRSPSRPQVDRPRWKLRSRSTEWTPRTR